jgi:hypothetical protein
MANRGNLEITNKTYVTAVSKETSIIKAMARNRQNHKNGRLLEKFLSKKS